MRNTGAATKREAVVKAIEEYNRRRRLDALVKEFGTFTDFMTQDDLARMRSDR
jgi:hypothetical protein